MTITGQSSLDKSVIDQMVRDAESHAEDDRRRKEEAEARNAADSLVYQTEKILREHGDKVPGPERDAAESALKELKDAVAGDDLDRIRAGSETLMGASQAFSQKLYEQTTAESYSDIKPPSDEDVVDAEIVDDENRSA